MVSARRYGIHGSPAECIGPLPVPAELLARLGALADSAGADALAPLAVCAAVLACRLSAPGVPRAVTVIHGEREAAPLTQDKKVTAAVTLREALRLTERRSADAGPGTSPSADPDMRIFISADGCRLFAETIGGTTDDLTVLGWARAFLRLLAQVADAPDVPLAAHPLASAAERDMARLDRRAAHVPVTRHRTVTGPFEEQAERTPDAVALLDEDGMAVTYKELNAQANRLAHFLRKVGAGPGARVGICFDRGVALIIAIYAVVKSGAAYVPLDADLPDSRLGYLLADTSPSHVLTDQACRHRVPPGPWNVIDVESDQAAWNDCPAVNLAAEGPYPPLLHILYTSGSTGRPKGVAYPADGVLAHLDWMQERYPFAGGDSAVLKTSPGFDVSVWEIFWPLYHGARLVLCRPGGHRDPRHLARLITELGVTTAFLPPAVIIPVLEAMPAGKASPLRWVLCGGEPVTPRIRDALYATLPDTTLVNCYGPTEAGGVTDSVVARDPGASVVPLGHPARHFRISLLDESLELVPAGLPGEAYIGGCVGISWAYWGAPARTAERFVADPYGPPGSRLYRTGDLCRSREDGVLEHLGRIDRQVKVHGMRVEPGEIESVLAAHPAVADCAVLAAGNPVRLIAFIVHGPGEDPGSAGTSAMAEHLAVLPRYMRPEAIVPVPCIPATVNGKVDKDALLRAWRERSTGTREITAPADELEAALVGAYRRVLGVGQVSVLDSFTQLGGHSLMAFQLLDECQEAIGVKPEVTQLLTCAIRDVARSIRAAGTERLRDGIGEGMR